MSMATKPRFDATLVKAKHVRQAAGILSRQESYKPFLESRFYDVLIDGKPFPPKAIVSKAYNLATNEVLLPPHFVGAIDGVWHRRLEALNFEVRKKWGLPAFEEEVTKSSALSHEKRLEAIARAGTKAKKVSCVVNRYERNPHVEAERLFLAQGICAGCKEPGPFKDKATKLPFLEVHHIKPLSRGGRDSVANTVALCPNCHSKVHYEKKLERDEE
jgi:5-methylcytosine-specific restriction endonuclease McrA